MLLSTQLRVDFDSTELYCAMCPLYLDIVLRICFASYIASGDSNMVFMEVHNMEIRQYRCERLYDIDHLGCCVGLLASFARANCVVSLAEYP